MKNWLTVVYVCVILTACGGNGNSPLGDTPDNTGGEQTQNTGDTIQDTNPEVDNAATTTEGDVTRGEELFTSKGCINCHTIGNTGIGNGSLEVPAGNSDASVGELESYIDANMPAGNAADCRGQCAADIAQYVWDTANGTADKPAVAARSLNLSSTLYFEEAENLMGTTGFALNNAWQLPNNGYISALVDFPEAGIYTLAVRAWGDQGGGEAVSMAFHLDGREIKSFDVTESATNPGLYVADINIDMTGVSTFSIWFNNDLYLPADGIDRNLYVDWVLVSTPSQVLAGRF